MNELEKKLNGIPGAYFAFVHAISKYACKKTERYDEVMDFLDKNPESTSSDVTLFVMLRPDFMEDDVRYTDKSFAEM